MNASPHTRARRELPEGYSTFWSFDITQTKEALNLSVWGTVIMLAAWIGYLALARALRPEAFPKGFLLESGSASETILFVVELVLVTVVMVFLHEGLHGLFFWIFTGTRPKFAFKVYYAYAAAPGWYFPRRQYLITATAPLIGITLLCLAALAWLPEFAAMPAFLLLVFNTSGAVGDIWVALRLLGCPADTLAMDHGDRIEFFAPARSG